MMFNKYSIVPFVGVLLLSGCANQEMYYWGSYESIVRQSYVEPGSMDAQTQIETLTSDLQQAEANGKKVPPGIYAHLGVLYAEQGKHSHSKEALVQEKILFPEASILVDGMLNRAKVK